jgi:hypothetical protein
MPGPPPKKDAERRRRNKGPEKEGALSSIPAEIVNVDELLVGEVEIPQPDPNWEPLTELTFRSFMSSGQVIWMEPSDWATLYVLCETLDRWLKPQDVKVGQTGSMGQESGGGDIEYIFEKKIVAMPGGVLSSILKGLSELMATEGSRRKLRIELERNKRLDAAASGEGKVVDIVQRRADAFKGA